MNDLTERQQKILKAIIEEYIDTASPVGSETIDKKYNLGVSPATIRNEMVQLTNLGFLKKTHFSAGRSPTPLALKYYVNNLMKEQQLPLTEEVAVKEKVWDYRHELDKFLREITKELAFRTKEMAITTTNEGDLYTAGMANLLEDPEFYDIDLTKTLLSFLDQEDFWLELLDRSFQSPSSLEVLLGSELGGELFEPCGFVYRSFKVGDTRGAIGVIGPARLNFRRIFPTVRYFGQLIDEVFGGW